MKKFALLLVLVILLTGCYQTTLTQVRLGDDPLFLLRISR